VNATKIFEQNRSHKSSLGFLEPEIPILKEAIRCSEGLEKGIDMPERIIIRCKLC
jgi:hypothetical protein